MERALTTCRRLGFVALLAAVILAGTLASSADALPVQGRLTIPPTVLAAGEDRGEHYWEEWNGFVAPIPTREDPSRLFAVVLTSANPATPRGCDLRLRGGAFERETNVARTNTPLRIENTDGCTHELYEQGGLFASLPTSPGHARRLDVIANPGHYTIRDRTYPHVIGHLHVLPDLVACAQVQSDGTYQFADVSPGQYTLKVYLRDRLAAEQSLVIDDERAEMNVDPIAITAGEQ